MRTAKVSFFLFLSSFLSLASVNAQFDDKYGRLRPVDVDMKECSFDPSASLVIMLDEASTDYNSFGEEVTYRHVRMKVLKEEGIKHADFALIYHSRKNQVIIDQLEGMSINIGENGFVHEYPVNKKSIFEKKVNKFLSKITFAFPQVKVGTIMEFKYRSTYTGTLGLNDWNFQQKFPVCMSSYQYKSHPRIEVSYAIQKSPEHAVIVKSDNESGKIYFQMNNVPGMGDEPYMDARESYLQKVRFQLSRYVGWEGLKSFMPTWRDAAMVLLERDDFGKQLRAKVPEADFAVQSLSVGKDGFAKMRAIHEYVRKNIFWNESEAILSKAGIKETWIDRKGNSASINLLLVYMLRSAGLDAHPVLISERGNGKVEKSSPYIDQFNNVYALVTLDNKKYFLNGTDKITTPGVTPETILNTTAFVVNKGNPELVDIEEQELKYKKIVVIEAELNENGRVSGAVNISSRDYARIVSLKDYQDNPGKYREQFVNNKLQIDSFKVSNAAVDSLPFIQTFNFKTDVERSAEYDFADLSPFIGFRANPFISENRVSDINFGYKSMYIVSYVLSIPPSKKVDVLPKNISLVNEDKTLSFSRQVVYNEQANQVISRVKIELNKTLYKADQYGDIKEFFKKMSNLLEEQCVIKNK